MPSPFLQQHDRALVMRLARCFLVGSAGSGWAWPFLGTAGPAALSLQVGASEWVEVLAP